MNHLLIQAWALYKQGDDYYLPYTHWIYLNEITRHAQLITLLSPVKQLSRSPAGMHRLSEIQHPIFVKTLPFSRNYIAAIKYFFHYRRAYARSKECSHA